ncbi:hypothetical protein ACFP81_04905 [Deinococcus lacus]|uniref:Tetratricopeptide repeat protein n=1 Tax=Deinococcus lacus TaxID=392561 RepID=A0ABW1YB80_9DEIO
MQALALVQLGNYAGAEQALNRAEEYGDVAAFAHPSTLRRLRELLRERPSDPAASPGPALNAEALAADPGAGDEPTSRSGPLPWWIWAAVGTGTGALGWGAAGWWRRSEAQRKAELDRATYEANKQLDQEIYAAQRDLAGGGTPEARRKLERLKTLQGQLRGWAQEPYQTAGAVQAKFTPLLAASLSDASWNAYQAELARQAAEEAQREAEREAEATARRNREGEPSSFSDDTDNTWSSGSSGSSGGNNGGSSW